MSTIVTFNRRKGPPLDFIDSRDHEAIAAARSEVNELALELEANPVGTTETPKLDAFLDKLRRVTARVRLNAALAFKESAGLHATWTADRFDSDRDNDDNKAGEQKADDKSIIFIVEPLDIRAGKDDTFDKRFSKLLLYFMSSSRARTRNNMEIFLAAIRSTSEILQHLQWLNNAMQVVAKLFAKLPGATELNNIMSKQTVDELDGTLRAALEESGAPFAEGQDIKLAPRDMAITQLLSDETRGISMSDSATGTVTTYPGLHKSPLVTVLRNYREPRDILERLVNMIVAHNREAPGADRYTTIANRIAFILTGTWMPFPDINNKPNNASFTHYQNKPLKEFLDSIKSREELQSLAETSYFKERGYKPVAGGRLSAAQILGGLYIALNNPPGPTKRIETSTVPSQTVKRGPGRPRKTDGLVAMPLGVSYVAESRLDPTGANDLKIADDILDETVVKAFRGEVTTSRGAKKKKKGSRDTEDGKKNADEESFSDKIKTNLARAARLQSIMERCEAMLYSPDAGRDETPLVTVPEFPRDKGSIHTHPDDSEYFRLRLQTTTLPKDGSAALVLRRRWWWAYMFVALVRIDMAGRRGPHVFKNRTYLEVSEFLSDPVAFASDDRRHWTVTGPPGTGKTSFLRLMGVLYHLLGLYPLSSINDRQVVVLQMRDLIAGYEGQSALRATEVFTDSIGTFAPIDEAYALVPVNRGESISPYSQQVIDTLLTVLNDARSLMGTALVGYSSGVLDRLLRTNDGLQRRFPRSFAIPEYNATDIASVLREALRLKNREDLATVLTKQRSELVDFFEFITGTQGVFTYKNITYQRDLFVQQRYDESDEDYKKREEAVSDNNQFGNLFAHENASGALDVVAIILRDKNLKAKTFTLTHVIDATRQLLLQRNLIEISEAERRQRESTSRRRDPSTDDD